VIALDANYIRTPISMVIENIVDKLESYIRRGAAAKLKSLKSIVID
jgi:hypothetical protein